MEKCYMCDSVLKKVKDEPYHYKEGGLDYVWLIGILQYKCNKCGETYVEIPHVNELHLLIGKYIVCKKELLKPQEVKFLRKELGMKSKALAEALSMKPETYSRWENGKQDIAACHDKTLRMIYVMHASEQYGKVLFQDSQYVLKELATRKASKKSKKIQFTASEWITRLIDEPIFGGEFCVA